MENNDLYPRLDSRSDYPEDCRIPEGYSTDNDNKTIIKVIGVGGGGCNVVSEIFRRNITGIDLMICNTDIASLKASPVNEKIKLGENLAKGLGAGCNPEVGKQAALASIDEIKKSLRGSTEMVFVTACMGGGTGTGAAPVIARISKEMGKLTVGVVTIPFRDEGKEEINRAMRGLQELQKYVDSLLIIDNQKIYKVFGNLPMTQGFTKANEVLVTAVKSITEFITKPGFVNVDFADVKMVMSNGGMAIMGIGTAKGADRARNAVQQAFESPLLNDCDLKTSKGVLMNVTCDGNNLRMDELNEAIQHVSSFTGNASKFKRGIITDDSMGDELCVTIIATGFEIRNLPKIAADSNKLYIGEDGAEETPPEENDREESIKNPFDSQQSKNKSCICEDTKSPYDYSVNKKPDLVVCEDTDILVLENEPAYLRRSVKKRGTSEDKFEEKGCVLKKIEGKNILSTDNSFLHQTQD